MANITSILDMDKQPGFLRVTISIISSFLQKIYSRLRTEWLVYQYPGNEKPDTLNFGFNHEWVFADKENIRLLFNADSHENALLTRYLDNGSKGVILVQQGEWACFAFMSIPGKNGPPHLPGWIKQRGYYWIYSCHTKEKFRGNGFYKQALFKLVESALNQNNNALIYIDTAEDNIASRRAIVATGFHQKGKMISYNLWIPYCIKISLYGKWLCDFLHNDWNEK